MTEGILIALMSSVSAIASSGLTFVLIKGKTRSETQLNELEAIKKRLELYEELQKKDNEFVENMKTTMNNTIDDMKESMVSLRRIITELFVLACKVKNCVNRDCLSDDDQDRMMKGGK